jgi:hypothetical protein
VDFPRVRFCGFADVPFWRRRTFADAVVLSWRSVPGNGRQIAE